MQLHVSNNGMYDQIKILTSKEQSNGFLDEETPEPYNSNQGRNLKYEIPSVLMCIMGLLQPVFVQCKM